MKYQFTVRLNGTNENPWHRYGLRCNPFPQIAKYEWQAAQMIVAELGGDPIPDVYYIRQKLKGFSEEFVELCCKKFVKGKMVEFDIFWNE